MYNRKMTLPIDRALRVNGSSSVAFTGAGGKTTALFQLARSLQPPVIVTTTTHFGAWQARMADKHIMTDSPAPIQELEDGLNGVLLITGTIDRDRTQPVHKKLLRWLHEFCTYHGIPLLIEADGSRQKPLKAWEDYEPAIPNFVNVVAQVAGLAGLGKPLNNETVHRAAIFSRLSGLAMGETISAEALQKVLIHPDGGLKHVSERARRIVLLNQADTVDLQSNANSMVQALSKSYDSVAIASLHQEKIFAVYEPTAAILLAAGSSSRYGETKQLLNWRGEPFVRVAARTALEAGCSPVIMVTGANAEQVELAVNGLNVLVVYNPSWKEGQASSIRTGLMPLRFPRTVPLSGSFVEPLPHIRQEGSSAEIEYSGAEYRAWKGVGSAIFLLADQPQITASVLRALMERHADGLPSILAPMVMDQRANPVLFDRNAFQDLASLQGDVGGRAIFHKHQVEYLPWHDDRLLLDVDTQEMYQRLISDESL